MNKSSFLFSRSPSPLSGIRQKGGGGGGGGVPDGEADP